MCRALVLALFILLQTSTASASLNGKEDFSEPRIAAVSAVADANERFSANGSAYLFNSRIAFSAGHMKDHSEGLTFYLSTPNSALNGKTAHTKVIKVYYPENYNNKKYSFDFSIMILEKPVGDFQDAPLITQTLLAEAISQKLSMKTTGYGVYKDLCPSGKSSPCSANGAETSLVPRSTYMVPWNASEVKAKYNQFDSDLTDHLFLIAPGKEGPCPGDSGGSTTVLLRGVDYYVGTVPSGFWNAYACGQSPYTSGDILGYTAPVFLFQKLIDEATTYVTAHPYVEPVKAAVPSRDHTLIADLAKQWASQSRSKASANAQCRTIRDKGMVDKNGKAKALAGDVSKIRKALKTKDGFQACVDAFSKTQ